MIVLIPSYQPTEVLPTLVGELRRARPGLGVLIVDDGSGPAFEGVFADAMLAGAEVIGYPENRGKGVALKTGIGHLHDTRPGEDIVTADADGQHTIADILDIGRALREDDSALVLGCRAFGAGAPWRSRVGNALSSALFRFATGHRIGDTQTGLRGLPSWLLPWLLGVPGERFEYEQNVLLRLDGSGAGLRQVRIETIYLDENSGSHFRPLADSLRVAWPVMLFAASSFAAFLVDTVALLLLMALTGWLVPSIIAARLLSASVNFALNRRVIFRQRGPGRFRQAAGYAVLAAALLVSTVVWMEVLTALGVPLLLAKIITEAVLFVLSYQAQRRYVFRPGAAKGPAGLTEPLRTASSPA